MSLPSLSSFFSSDYPPAAFSFKVVFTITGLGGFVDTSFAEVSGMKSEIETEEFREGGQNLYVHKLPVANKKPNLVLKRGIAPITSPLVIWCKSVMEGYFILPIIAQPIIVQLLDENGAPLRAWSFMNAWPVKWEVQEFGAQKNEVAIEMIELSYTYSNRLM
jgi:phage tail-like protein